MMAFSFREGSTYRMRLTFNESQHMPGKTSEDVDEVEVRSPSEYERKITKRD